MMESKLEKTLGIYSVIGIVLGNILEIVTVNLSEPWLQFIFGLVGLVGIVIGVICLVLMMIRVFDRKEREDR